MQKQQLPNSFMFEINGDIYDDLSTWCDSHPSAAAQVLFSTPSSDVCRLLLAIGPLSQS